MYFYSVEVILREEVVESVQAGDRFDFTGTLIVVPDVGALSLPGARAESGAHHKMGEGYDDGIRGLKALGVRDLKYRMAFLACSVTPTNPRVSLFIMELLSYYFFLYVQDLFHKNDLKAFLLNVLLFLSTTLIFFYNCGM